MNNALKTEEIIKQFNSYMFSNNDLYNFYKQNEPDLKETTFRWRVYKLKEKKIISSPKRGKYIISKKNPFIPIIDDYLIKIYKKLKEAFPYTDICIWRTSWLNEFMTQQVITNNIIIEIEKEAMQSAYSLLLEDNKNIYVKPTKKEIDLYILGGVENIIIKNLNKESPVMKIHNIIIPKIEKILIDIFKEKELFIQYQGNELINIYEELLNNYLINYSTIKRYATRRKIYQSFKSYLKDEVNISKIINVYNK